MDESSGQPSRIGILGGTFDPIHTGHLVAVSEAIHKFGLDRVFLVPAGRPWQKAGYSDAEDRLVMATLATATDPRLAVSRVELDRRGPTYTVDTLEEFKRFFPHAELFFIVGADVALELRTWHRVADIAGLAQVVAVTRSGSDLTSLPTESGLPAVHVMEMPAVDISSTEIRERVASNTPIDHLVPAEVARYIKDHGLYSHLQEVRGA
jgi:nicotinate-nucleotide adenylyltransferase